jgi:transposase
MGNGTRPTPEFRRGTVRLALTSGRTRREIAEDLGILRSTLTRWLREEPATDDLRLHRSGTSH